MFFDWIGMFSQTLQWITYCIATLVISSSGIIIIIIIITDRNYETEFINKLTHLPFCRYLSQFNWGTGIGEKIATVDTMLYAYSHFLFSHTMQIISFYWIIAHTHTQELAPFFKRANEVAFLILYSKIAAAAAAVAWIEPPPQPYQ